MQGMPQRVEHRDPLCKLSITRQYLSSSQTYWFSSYKLNVRLCPSSAEHLTSSCWEFWATVLCSGSKPFLG